MQTDRLKPGDRRECGDQPVMKLVHEAGFSPGGDSVLDKPGERPVVMSRDCAPVIEVKIRIFVPVDIVKEGAFFFIDDHGIEGLQAQRAEFFFGSAGKVVPELRGIRKVGQGILRKKNKAPRITRDAYLYWFNYLAYSTTRVSRITVTLI